jgi:DNA-binding beta-propeller fold protein YncE
MIFLERIARRWFTVMACALALVGCASTPSVPVPELPPLTWPDEVDVPARIAFVKVFSTAGEFGVSRGFFQRMADFIFGPNDTRLVRPMAVVVQDGVVYVADPGARGVHRFDAKAGRHELIFAKGEQGLPSPVGLAVGNAGEIYVADSELARIFVIRPGADSAEELTLPAMVQPTGLAVDSATGRLIVVDTAAHHVNLFNPDGTLHQRFGVRGSGAGEFNFPTLVWRDTNGLMYVTDSLNFRVQVFDAEGGFIRQFGKLGDSSGDNMRQKGVATDRHGHVYIVDALFNAIQVFDQTGQLLMSFGNLGSDRGEFWLPSGIYIGSDDLIYVADSQNKRVQVFRYVGDDK